MLKKDDNDIADIICYGFLAIIIFTCTFPWVFILAWLLADWENKDWCYDFANLFRPKFWYNLTKETIHNNWNKDAIKRCRENKKS
jgi:hypothetical protein